MIPQLPYQTSAATVLLLARGLDERLFHATIRAITTLSVSVCCMCGLLYVCVCLSSMVGGWGCRVNKHVLLSQ